MMTRKGTGWIALVMTLVLGQSLTAAPQGPRNQQQKDAAAPAAVGPTAQSNEELAAFKAVQDETNPTTRLTLADTFLTTYPSTEFAGYIHRFRMEAFAAQNKPKEAIAAGETALDLENKLVASMIAKADAQAAEKNKPKNLPPALDKNSPAFKSFVSETEKSKLYYYQRIMTAYQQLNDAAKTIEYGEKAMAQEPNDLLSLLTVSGVMAERPPTSELEKEAHFKKAEGLSKQAVEKVTALVSSPGAAQMSPAQKSGLQSTVHQTLGKVYLDEKKYGDAQKEFLAALAAKKDDPVSYFRLGLAYAQAEKADEAMDALAKSVFLGGLTQSQASDILKKLYQAKKKTLDGFDDFVKASGQKISQ